MNQFSRADMSHLTPAELKGYVDRRLSASEVAGVLDHIGECQQCADRVAELRRSGEPAKSEVDEEDLVHLVTGGLSAGERHRVEAHLQSCGSCSDAVMDLQEFRRELVPNRASRALRFPLRWLVAAAAVLVVAFTLVSVRRHQAQPAPVLMASVQDASGLIGVTASGELVGLSPAAGRELVEQALRTGALPRGPARTDPLREVQRGATAPAPAFELQYPVSQPVFSVRPRFEWSELKGATAYEVHIFDENFNERARSGKLTTNSWQAGVDLTRGGRYVWQVIAYRGTQKTVAPVPPQPEARFEVAPQSVADRIDKARAGNSHLLLAVLYAQEGMHREASAELDNLASSNPNSPTIASLRHSLR